VEGDSARWTLFAFIAQRVWGRGEGVGTFLRPFPLLISKRSASDDTVTGLKPGREIER
jgi:hypothetical protein